MGSILIRQTDKIRWEDSNVIKKINLLLLGAMMVFTVSGCGQKEEVTEEPTTQTEATTEEVTTEEEDIGPEGCARSFLTGEWIPEEDAQKRPVAVMFENSAASIPSYGSSKASVYYEAEAEGGITRIMCIFEDYSDMDKIGNVRSTRPYFLYNAIAFDSMLSHCGGSIEAYETIIDLGYIDNLDSYKGEVGFYRSSDRSAPHNLYTSSEGIEKAIEANGYNRNHPDDYEGYLHFTKDDENEVVLKDGMDCAVVTPYQSDCKPWFVYNEEDGLYYRYEFGREQIDAATNTQLSVKNVLIQLCDVEAYYDQQNHDRVDTTITGTGRGYYITNGKAIEIKWECEAEGQAPKYYDMDGNELAINHGKTWIDIVDTDNADKIGIYATLEEYQSRK